MFVNDDIICFYTKQKESSKFLAVAYTSTTVTPIVGPQNF